MMIFMTRTLRGDPDKLEIKRRLRVEMTPAERTLWSKLCRRQFLGLKFRKQHGIGPFVVDFFCPEKQLVIEVDGEVHDDEEQKLYDHARAAYLCELGLKIIRYRNAEILQNPDGVLRSLHHHLEPPPC